LCYAEDPDTKALYLEKEYLQGGRTAAQHAAELKTWGCRLWVGGSKSEGQWRQEFQSAGLPIVEPEITEVEVGIDRVYGVHKKDELYVFDTCAHYLEQKGTYSRELDDTGQPTEKIKNKDTYHFMDAERYIIGKIRGGMTRLPERQPVQSSKWTASESGYTALEDEGEDTSKWKRY
jgi:hypothetical protein